MKAVLKKHEHTLFVLKDEPQEYTLATKANSNRGMKIDAIGGSVTWRNMNTVVRLAAKFPATS